VGVREAEEKETTTLLDRGDRACPSCPLVASQHPLVSRPDILLCLARTSSVSFAQTSVSVQGYKEERLTSWLTIPSPPPRLPLDGR
jgi:hypothetical protein